MCETGKASYQSAAVIKLPPPHPAQGESLKLKILKTFASEYIATELGAHNCFAAFWKDGRGPFCLHRVCLSLRTSASHQVSSGPPWPCPGPGPGPSEAPAHRPLGAPRPARCTRALGRLGLSPSCGQGQIPLKPTPAVFRPGGAHSTRTASPALELGVAMLSGVNSNSSSFPAGREGGRLIFGRTGCH